MVELTQENYDELLINSEKPVFVDFYATWCGPCKRLKPEFEKFAESNTNVISVIADVDKIQSKLENLKINSVPTLILFDNGLEVKRYNGFLSVDELEKFVSDI